MAATSALVKICLCGHTNHVFANSCQSCGSDLVHIPKTEVAPASAPPPQPADVLPRAEAELRATDGSNLRFALRQGAIVGRGPGTVDASPLRGSDMISRQHARAHHDAAGWTIEALSKLNPTRINGVEVPAGNRASIRAGDTLSLAGVSFVFVERRPPQN